MLHWGSHGQAEPGWARGVRGQVRRLRPRRNDKALEDVGAPIPREQQPMKVQPIGRWRRPGSAKQKLPLPPAGSPAPPAAHQARLRPAPRMRPVPPLKGQRVRAGSSSCCCLPTTPHSYKL